MGNLIELKQLGQIQKAQKAPVAIDFEELNAWNAAFHELGLRWHWDAVTYASLLHAQPDSKARVRHYIGSEHPHLFKAYDAEFLIAAIESKKRLFEAAMSPTSGERDYFDWAQSRAGELGS